MATSYLNDGAVIDYVAGSAITSGDVVAMNDTVGIAMDDIASGSTGPVRIEGVFSVTKTAGVAWVVGDSIDWDASTSSFHKGITPAAGDIALCCVCVEAADSSATTGKVKLTPGTGTGS